MMLSDRSSAFLHVLRLVCLLPGKQQDGTGVPMSISLSCVSHSRSQNCSQNNIPWILSWVPIPPVHYQWDSQMITHSHYYFSHANPGQIPPLCIAAAIALLHPGLFLFQIWKQQQMVKSQTQKLWAKAKGHDSKPEWHIAVVFSCVQQAQRIIES